MASQTPDGRPIDPAENRRRMAAGELYYAFTPDLIADRKKCKLALSRYNSAAAAGDTSRRELVKLWRSIACDGTPLPPMAPTPQEDDSLFEEEPWIDGPIRTDYGYNVKLGKGVYVNSNSVWIDTCTITIGARTMMGPSCSFYSGSHPLDPAVRNGLRGPESGKPITVGEDCWLGGGVTVLPGVTIGKGSTVGAGSVVTKDVPPFVCVVGNPARIIRKIESVLAGIDGGGAAAASAGVGGVGAVRAAALSSPSSSSSAGPVDFFAGESASKAS